MVSTLEDPILAEGNYSGSRIKCHIKNNQVRFTLGGADALNLSNLRSHELLRTRVEEKVPGEIAIFEKDTDNPKQIGRANVQLLNTLLNQLNSIDWINKYHEKLLPRIKSIIKQTLCPIYEDTIDLSDKPKDHDNVNLQGCYLYDGKINMIFNREFSDENGHTKNVRSKHTLSYIDKHRLEHDYMNLESGLEIKGKLVPGHLGFRNGRKRLPEWLFNPTEGLKMRIKYTGPINYNTLEDLHDVSLHFREVGKVKREIAKLRGKGVSPGKIEDYVKDNFSEYLLNLENSCYDATKLN
ncbi:hypothetical protein GF374_00915 [Candidatus Woesearchaeota archaeon]|nr:hypothetical protein [Candidatus Woesearchaeota archaeon]